MNAWDALEQLGPNPEPATAARLAGHYAALRQAAPDPVRAARAAANQGLALALVPGTPLAEVMAALEAGLAGLTEPAERGRIHYEAGQVLTRARHGALHAWARQHFAAALADLRRAGDDPEASTGAAAVLGGLALIAYRQQEYDTALGLEQRALLCLERCPPLPAVWQQRLNTALRAGDVCRKGLQEYANARHYYRLARRCARHAGLPGGVALAQQALAALPVKKKGPGAVAPGPGRTGT